MSGTYRRPSDGIPGRASRSRGGSDCAEGDEGAESLGELVVADRHSTILLELAEQPLDAVSGLAMLEIDRTLGLRAPEHRNFGGDPARLQTLDDGDRVVGAVGGQHVGRKRLAQRDRFGAVVDLAAGQPEARQASGALGQHVDLGAKPAS